MQASGEFNAGTARATALLICYSKALVGSRRARASPHICDNMHSSAGKLHRGGPIRAARALYLANLTMMDDGAARVDWTHALRAQAKRGVNNV